MGEGIERGMKYSRTRIRGKGGGGGGEGGAREG
jgi:hypothetical protein